MTYPTIYINANLNRCYYKLRELGQKVSNANVKERLWDEWNELDSSTQNHWKYGYPVFKRCNEKSLDVPDDWRKLSFSEKEEWTKLDLDFRGKRSGLTKYFIENLNEYFPTGITTTDEFKSVYPEIKFNWEASLQGPLVKSACKC
jgi:hypothetical protein